MKNTTFIISLFMIVGLVSCNNFLEEDPRNERDSKSFFQNANDAYSAVNILYKKGVPLRYNMTSIHAGMQMMDGGFLSGLYNNEYKGQEPWIVHAQTLSLDGNVDNGHLQSMWQGPYEAIVRNANYAIKHIPDCPGLTKEEKTKLLAEAKFFRALNYFHLVKSFGAIPLITDYYKSLDDIYVKRAKESSVYNLIIHDLEEALAANLPNKPFTENGFRISRGTVAALLADVYLNMAGYPVKDESKYDKAAEISKSLINDSNYALILNVDKAEKSAYNTIRTSDNEKEYLYTIEYAISIYEGGQRPMLCFPNTAATWGEFKYNICNLAYEPEAMLLKVYDEKDDLRFQDGQYFHRSYQQRNGSKELREFGRPLPYFWWEETAALETGTSVKNQTHYRLAEMYLIAAEAIVKSKKSVTDEAVDYLATIKARASLTKNKATIKSELLSANLSIEEFVEEVWKEKIREFIFEFKIWNDITRVRKYPAIKANGDFGFVDLIGATNPYGKVFTEEKVYFPICAQELQRNPLLSDSPE